MAMNDRLYCAAIDFGTTFTGLGFGDRKNNTTFLNVWGKGGPKGVEVKAPTTVLFNPHGIFDAFGFDAVKKYGKMNDKQKWDCYYFERFKMELHQEKVGVKNKLIHAILILIIL